MKCHRHHERDAVGVCAACGKGLCADACAHDGDAGLHCDAACARRLLTRERAAASNSNPVAWGWSTLLVLLGAALLYYGYLYSEWSMSVPNLLGMLFVWYGAVLLVQRAAQRAPKPKLKP